MTIAAAGSHPELTAASAGYRAAVLQLSASFYLSASIRWIPQAVLQSKSFASSCPYPQVAIVLGSAFVDHLGSWDFKLDPYSFCAASVSVSALFSVTAFSPITTRTVCACSSSTNGKSSVDCSTPSSSTLTTPRLIATGFSTRMR